MTIPKFLLAPPLDGCEGDCVQARVGLNINHAEQSFRYSFAVLASKLHGGTPIYVGATPATRIVPSRPKGRAGEFSKSAWTISPEVAMGDGLDGCCPETWLHSARKSAMRLRASALSGRSGTVDRTTGAAARAGVASKREAATTVGMSLSGTGLQADRSPASNGNLIRVKTRCSGTTRIPQSMPSCFGDEHRSPGDRGVVPVSSHFLVCPSCLDNSL